MLSDDRNDILNPPDIFAQLSKRERARVEQRAVQRQLAAGDSLFRQGAPHRGIYIVTEGLVRVFYTAPSGREVTLGYWSAGHFAGGPEVFGRGRHIWSGEAAVPTTVLFLRGKDLHELVYAIPGLAVGVIEGLIFKGKCYSAMCCILGTRSVVDRLLLLLQLLADLYGEPTADGVRIARGFTHESLASLVGATRQWVTMTMRRLEQQGVLRRAEDGLVLRHGFASATANWNSSGHGN